MKISLFFFLLFCRIVCFSQPSTEKIYLNGNIWTGDVANPWAKTIVTEGHKIIFVGTNYTSKEKNSERIDLNGKMVVPGFIDNHTHFLSGGYGLSGVDLRKAKTPGEFINILRKFSLQYPDQRWIQGGEWDHEAWGGELPSKEWIDSVTGDHPLFVSRYDGHMAFANSKALAIAKITRDTKSPSGGEIIRDKNGDPTGVLKDGAMSLIYRVIPDASEKELDEYFLAGQQHAFENGVTQIHDMGSYGGWIDMATYKRAEQNSKLNLRVYSFVNIIRWRRLDSVCKADGKGNDMLRWGGVKGFVDGSLGSTTAWFYEPYLDAPDKTGLLVSDTIGLKRWILSADSCGLHVAIHAIGDRANDYLLDIFSESEKTNPGKDHRFRIEHAQHLSEKAIPLFTKQQVIASMQPYHAIDDGRWAYKRLDPERLRGTYAFKSLVDSKAILTFGSDWSVAPLTPLEGIYAAVTRRTLDEKNPRGWYPEQKITVEQALKCYTANNAYAGFQEKKLGMLKKDMLSDFVVLSENLFEIPPEKIKDVKVLRTVVNGKDVFVRKSN